MFDTSHFHPMIVHFPIALIIVAFLFDIAAMVYKKEPCFIKIGLFLLILGTLGSVAGYLTGEFFTKELSGEAGNLKETHEIFAKITMFTAIAVSLLRIYMLWFNKTSPTLKWTVFSLMAIIAVTIGITGYLGGSLVYNFMIGL